jgi:hypothetical protein
MIETKEKSKGTKEVGEPIFVYSGIAKERKKERKKATSGVGIV